MSNGKNFSKIVEAASTHYDNLKTDIRNAQNRIEHIRLSALAQEAHNLLTDLRVFETGLVYTHTASSNGHLTAEQLSDNVVDGEYHEVLDLPEFKSPYNPDLK